MQSAVGQTIFAAYQRRDYATVTSLFAANMTVKNCDANSGICYANALRHTGQLTAAKKAYDTLVKRFSSVPPVMNGYANLLIQMKAYDAAVKQLKSALRSDAQFVEAFINLGRVQVLQKKYAFAIQSYQKALSLKPNDLNCLQGLADAFRKSGDNANAEAIYQRVLSQSAGNPPISVMLSYAGLLRDSQRLNESTSLLKQALQFDPNNSLAFNKLAANMALQSDMQGATQAYQRALQLAPDNVNLLVEFSHFAWAQGFEQPFSHIIDAANREPHRGDLVGATLDLLLNAEQFALVRVVLDVSMQHLGQDPYFLMFAARTERLCGSIEQATKYINLAVKKADKPTPVSIENERGYIALADKDAQTAVKIYRSLQSREPSNQGWWTLYSTALKLLGENEAYTRLCDYGLVYSRSVFVDKPQSFLSELTKSLEDIHANTRHPIGQSLRNGTQTYEDIFDNQLPIIQELKTWILETAQSRVKSITRNNKHPFLRHAGADIDFTGSWSVNLHKGGYHISHFHPQGWLSGVFYVDVPEDVEHGGQGWLQFGVAEIDQLSVQEDYAIKPSPGTVVLFPSFMWHGTRAFHNGKRRMTVAFDLVPKLS